MPATDSTALPVLVVGATGSLGSKVVDELLGRGKNVRALVRPASDASRLESRGVEIARGDMLNVDSLVDRDLCGVISLDLVCRPAHGPVLPLCPRSAS
ncbi:NmrA family NAD(P)-binding protein [Streptomyces sp. NPDC048415]|jgi:nucleoside-diphosphate-sugar epimerase|uniref:NmrA family NAD(P)-binding protein n=1 Tax=Streptomyces sp. NPDC048415 TaxID=3154822 RepID=UPI003438D383